MSKADKKILVVDDDRRLLDLLEDTLSTIGYSTTCVSSAHQALETLTKTKYELVITDIRMPEMDGIALLKVIRQEYPNLPVIFITGKTKFEISGNSKPEGFLAKPFRISNLEELIERTLQGKNEAGDIKTRRVLVVDDDESFLEMMVEALKVSEYETESAKTPEVALNILNNSQFDAVISDIKLPIVDGISLAKSIKQKFNELPVILVTAEGSFELIDFEEQIKMADGVLEKPFRLESVLDMLDRVTNFPRRVTKNLLP